MERKEEDVMGKKLLDVLPEMKDTQGYKDLLRAINGETIHNEIYYSPFQTGIMRTRWCLLKTMMIRYMQY
jgi:hypothetical protein